MGENQTNTMEPVGWGFYFVGLSLLLAQCDFARGESCESSQLCLSFQKDLLTNCLLFLGVCFLTWSWGIPQMRHVTHTIGVAVVGHSKLSQDGTSGCLTVCLLCQSLRISHGHEVFKCLNT